MSVTSVTHTVAELAERWKVNRTKVHGFIASGALAAIDVSQSQGDRPRWRISDEAVRAFEESRRSKPVKTSTRTKCPKSVGKVKSFIK